MQIGRIQCTSGPLTEVGRFAVTISEPHVDTRLFNTLGQEWETELSESHGSAHCDQVMSTQLHVCNSCGKTYFVEGGRQPLG